jgi:light-regulated signal transduction histidine kinase (bacteriophytochrome)
MACAIIKDNAIKMNKLINDLLKLSRVSQKEMLFTEIDMNALVDKVFEEVTTEEQRQKISYNRDELKTCNGDISLITQVLVNLISNAVKYTGKKEQPAIEITSQVSDTHVTYTIRDNGAGFDMKYADRLFNVFQRLHSEREFEGVGVGLAIVHRIISKHEGKVKAKGAVGQGAEFSFSLPRSK